MFGTRVDQLREALRTRVDEALQAALAGTIGQDGDWNAFLATLGIAPLSPEQRLEIQRMGVPNMRGALPVEVRRALEKVQMRTGDEVRRLKREIRAAGAEEPDSLGAFERELEESVAKGIERYVAKAKPQVTVGGIFANAQATTRRYADPGQKVATKRCGCCGAARPAQTELTHCAFCGNQMFNQV